MNNQQTKFKILIYAGNGGSGGLKVHCKGFLSACSVDEDIEVVFLCTSQLANYVRLTASKNVRLIEMEECGITLKRLVLGNKIPSSVLSVISQEAPDFLYFFNSVIYNGVEEYKTVLGMHNQLYINKKQLKRMKFSKSLLSLCIQRHFALKSMEKADMVIFDSNQSLDETLQNQICIKKSCVAYYGIEQEERQNTPHNVELGNPIQLLYVSTIYPYKNQVDLVEGVAELKQRGYAVKLHLVGSGPQFYVDQLKSKISDLGVSDEVVIYSWMEHSKIKEMIDNTDIFVYASSIETSGLGLMEGMVRGAVIACNAESCMPEILGDGGLLFDVHDKNSFADTIERLVQQPKLRVELSKKALEVSEKYTWENHVRTVFEEIKQLNK